MGKYRVSQFEKNRAAILKIKLANSMNSADPMNYSKVVAGKKSGIVILTNIYDTNIRPNFFITAVNKY